MSCSEYLLDHPQILRGKTVIELGAGSALPSMIAFQFCEEVTATDLDHVLKITRKSIELNKNGLKSRIKVSKCDWDDPNLDTQFDGILLIYPFY
jgi:predicted nicotinamide N-methyase